MTTTAKIITGIAITGTALVIWHNYQKMNGKTFMGKPLEPAAKLPASETAGVGINKTSGVDGFDNFVNPNKKLGNAVPPRDPSDRRYPPHIYVKGKGYTDWQGKLI